MRKYCILLLMAASTVCWAQTDSINKLSVGLNLTAHGETCGGGLPKNGDVSATEDKSHFLFGRTRINADYERRGLQIHAVIQNEAVWGMSGNQSLNLYEGWAKLTAKNGLFAQLGRIALSYDDERIIGSNELATASLTHDVVRVGYEGHGHRAHVILAYNQNGNKVYDGTYYDGGAQHYKTMQTLWYHYDVPKFPLCASLLFMNIGMQAGAYTKAGQNTVPDESNPPTTKYQQIWGGYVKLHPNHLTLEGSYYRQTGKMVDVATKYFLPIKAWMASAKATFQPAEQYGFTLGYDYLSGDSYVPVAYSGPLVMVQHSEFGGFTPLYGSRTKFYGIMDYYYESAYTNGFTPGLQNAYICVNATPTPQLGCSATYHYLAVATSLSNLNRTLGHSIDLQASYQFTKDIMLQAGYTLMFGSETMDYLKQDGSSKRARWGWFTLAISPSLFTTKW